MAYGVDVVNVIQARVWVTRVVDNKRSTESLIITLVVYLCNVLERLTSTYWVLSSEWYQNVPA
jgi:hypothetical protein